MTTKATSNVYDARHAKALVPLLRSITNEIQERTRAIAQLEVQLAGPTRADGDDQGIELEDRVAAELSIHRRQLRLATRELERLGCALDQDHPLRVRIPGSDGKLDHGFVWSPLDETVHAG